MKVLWFSNTPANASEYLEEGPVGGGWLKALDKLLQEKVDLHIAFYYPKKDVPFKYLNTVYYPISDKYWKLKILKAVFWKDIVDQQDLGKFLEIIRQVKPDIIHIHGTENPFSCIIPFVKIPVVVSIQGCITVYTHKFQNSFSKNNLRISSIIFGKTIRQFLRRKSFIATWKEFKKMTVREQVNLKNTKYIIGRTSWDRRVTSILAPDRIYYHCDELMREVFYKKKWKYFQHGKLIIHSTISNSTFKGFETICETILELERIPDLNFEWQIAGINHNDSIVKVTKNKLKRKFPEKGILYLGLLTENELAERLLGADIYVSPTHIDNSPNSLCEPMMLGMPCISTFVGGTGSLLTDGEDGIMIQDGDPWALAGAILELYNQPDIARKYGEKAQETAYKRHNHEKIVKDLINVYKEIIVNQTF